MELNLGCVTSRLKVQGPKSNNLHRNLHKTKSLSFARVLVLVHVAILLVFLCK